MISRSRTFWPSRGFQRPIVEGEADVVGAAVVVGEAAVKEAKPSAM